MLVKNFIQGMQEHTITEDNLKEILNIKKYVPLELKRNIIEEALLPNILKLDNSMYTYNSIDKYLMFTTTTLTLYTDLQFESVSQDYDALCEKEYINLLLESIGNDYFDFRDLFEMRFVDKIRETNTLESIVNSGIQEALFEITSTLTQVNEAIKKLDDNTVLNFIDNLNKKFKK